MFWFLFSFSVINKWLLVCSRMVGGESHGEHEQGFLLNCFSFKRRPVNKRAACPSSASEDPGLSPHMQSLRLIQTSALHHNIYPVLELWISTSPHSAGTVNAFMQKHHQNIKWLSPSRAKRQMFDVKKTSGYFCNVQRMTWLFLAV